VEKNPAVYATVELTRDEAHALTSGWGLVVAALIRSMDAVVAIHERLDSPDMTEALTSVTRKLDKVQVQQIDDLIREVSE